MPKRIISVPRGYLEKLGVLRSLLLASALVITGMGPFVDGTADLHSWRIFPTVIAPTLMVILAFSIPLDMTMLRIFMSDSTNNERQRLGFVIRVEAIILVVMLAAWYPFVLKVFAL
ncbi:MAG: hypothetical protein HYX63_05580 [Gammaproteobacteria bacterium]|nr:hypothetical protein [Gammaproteobacteria bacterium]